MTDHRFLQIHFLTPYSSALLNRDDSGLAKRLPYGGAMRTRISSQCLKRHWRDAILDPHALNKIEGFDEAYRSREIIDRKVLIDMGDVDTDVMNLVRETLLKAVYGKDAVKKESRQTLLLGNVEIAYLRNEAKKLIDAASGNVEKVKQAVEEWHGNKQKKDFKNFKDNFAAMRKNTEIPDDKTKLPTGLVGALFGRMITSVPEANITAPVHVAHAFTVHQEETESDYFVAVDDLAREEDTGTDTIQETELTSGLYYGYVVVDIKGLLDNLGGNESMAGEVLHNLIYLIAEVSPGAKLGSTAPYSRASLMLLEAGDRQPRSLAEAYRKPCKADLESATSAMSSHLAELDANYATGENRKVMSLIDPEIPSADKAKLQELADWAKSLPVK